MSRHLFLVALVTALTLLTGCIEFMDQTVTYSYDAKSDTLRIFQDYHGIFGADRGDGLSADETEQFDSVLKGQRTFFFSNWIFEFNAGLLREQLKNYNDPDQRKEMKKTPAVIEREEQLIFLLLDNVKVEDGPFYLDADGRLCGVQKVTVTKTSKIIASANEVIRDAYKAEAEKEETSPQEKAIFLKATERPKEFIKLEGNRLTVTLPVTREEYEKSFGGGADAPKQVAEFRKSGGRASYENGEGTWSLGAVTDKLTSLTMSMSDKAYMPNMLAVARKRPGVQEKFDAKAAAGEFFGPAASGEKKSSR